MAQVFQHPISSQGKDLRTIAVKMTNVSVARNDLELLFARKRCCKQPASLQWIELIVFTPKYKCRNVDSRHPTQCIDKKRLLSAGERQRHERFQRMGVGKQATVDFGIGSHFWSDRNLGQRNSEVGLSQPPLELAHAHQRFEDKGFNRRE